MLYEPQEAMAYAIHVAEREQTRDPADVAWLA
jgi:hypothetical protein